MIPVLYASDQVFKNTNGKGKLVDTISCIVHEELNGDYSLELKYPVTGELYEDLVAGGVICAYTPTVENETVFDLWPEYFDIYKHSVPINGVVTFYASHVSRRLAKCAYCSSQVYSDPKLEYAHPDVRWISGSFTPGKITFYVRTTSANPYVPIDEPKSALAAIIGDGVSSKTAWGREFIFTCKGTYAPSGEEKLTPVCSIIPKNRRGKDGGVTIRFGYNLVDINYEKDESETFNAVAPYWDDGSGNRTFVSGFLVQPTTPITPIKAVPLDCSDAFDTQPTGTQLAEYAQAWLDANTPWVNIETIDADFINGAEIWPNGSPVRLGDTLTVEFADASVKKQMRAVAYDFDVLSEAYTKMQLGTQPTNFVSVTGIDASGASGTGRTIQEDRVLLWSNTANNGSLANFAPQTLTLDLSKYSFVDIVYSPWGATSELSVQRFFVGASGELSYTKTSADNTSDAQHFLNGVYRSINVTITGIVFSAGQMIYAGGAYQNWNNRAIPYHIYGIK